MGFGSDPAGTSGAGTGVPLQSPALVADGYQKSSTGAVSSVLVDGLARDLVIDSFGTEEGMSDAAQLVQFAFGTVKGEIAVEPGRGIMWPAKLGDNVRAYMQAQAERVMAPLQNAGIAQLESVEIATEGTKLYGVVTWRDLRTGNTQPIKLPIG